MQMFLKRVLWKFRGVMRQIWSIWKSALLCLPVWVASNQKVQAQNKPATFLHDRLWIWQYGACMRKMTSILDFFLSFFLLFPRYAALRDPAGWLSVNPVRGTVNTSAPLDRESPYVHDNKYTALFIATDNGEFQLPYSIKTSKDN